MSKPEITTINNHRIADGAVSNNSTSGNPVWDDLRQGLGTPITSSISPRIDCCSSEHAGGGSFSTPVASFTAFTGRSGAFFISMKRVLFSFDTSGISSRGPDPSSGTISIPFKLNTANTENVASDHKVILAMATADALNADATIVDNDATTIFEIEGATGADSWDSTLAKASEPFNVTDFPTSSTSTEIALTSTALKGIKKNDVVGIWIMDYTYTVLDQNPETAAPSAGARTRWSIQKFGSTTPAVLTITAGGKKDEVPDKERIEKDFTINSFADITKQRTRFTKDGAIVDQVPFLLGTKGPLSLRGRQFGDDGKPISVTVDPPNTSKS